MGQDHKDSSKDWQRRKQKRSCRGCSQTRCDLSEYSHSQGFGFALCLQTSTRNLCLWPCLGPTVKHKRTWTISFSVRGRPRSWDKECEGVFLRAVQDVLFRCRHSTGYDHTRDATTDWVSWEVQQDTAGDGKTLAHWLWSSQVDVGSSNSPRKKDQELGCEARRKEMPSRVDEMYKT